MFLFPNRARHEAVWGSALQAQALPNYFRRNCRRVLNKQGLVDA